MVATQASTPSTDHLPRNPVSPTWCPGWERAKERHRRWWRGEDLVFHLTAPLDTARENLPTPPEPADVTDQWIGLPGRLLWHEHDVNHTFFAAEAVPVSHAMCIGAGDLAAMLGAGWHFTPQTVWYEPCINDPDRHPPLRLDRQSPAFVRLTEMVVSELHHARGRYLVGIPDLIENIDALASLRGTQALLYDMFDRPDWIEHRLREINQAYFEAFDHFYELTRDEEGCSVFAAFDVWGPGKTAKVQCDACSMFGPQQFERFVVPALTEQCRWLDHSMFHLDGEECWPNLDALLGIESLDAIEWTPKHAYDGEGGGHPKWYDLYRRIKAAGKSVQAITVKPDEVIPLLDAVGPQGMYIICRAPSQTQAAALLDRVQPYYTSDTPD